LATRVKPSIVVTAIVAEAVGAMIPMVLARKGAAQGSPATIGGKPNLNGVWQALNEAHWDLEAHEARAGAVTQAGYFPFEYARVPAAPVLALGSAGGVPASLGVVDGDGRIPYKPEAAAVRKANAENWIDRDPELKCYLPGIPRAMYMPYPFQIVQTPEAVLITHEFNGSTRIVRMNWEEESPVDNTFFMGWSRGRWEDDTLVIDVTGLNEKNWFDRAGNFYSDAAHVVERIKAVSPYHLSYEATVDDPKVFTRPWKMSFPLYRRMEPDVQLMEFKCQPFVEELLYGRFTKKSTS
jgi:hypothetical protein